MISTLIKKLLIQALKREIESWEIEDFDDPQTRGIIEGLEKAIEIAERILE